MNKIALTLMGTLSLALSGPASAAAFACPRWTLAQVATGSDGTVFVQPVGGGVFHICNLATGEQGLPKESCHAWLSKLLTAFALNRGVMFHFDTTHPANQGMSINCDPADFNWNRRVPYYVPIVL